MSGSLLRNALDIKEAQNGPLYFVFGLFENSIMQPFCSNICSADCCEGSWPSKHMVRLRLSAPDYDRNRNRIETVLSYYHRCRHVPSKMISASKTDLIEQRILHSVTSVDNPWLNYDTRISYTDCLKCHKSWCLLIITIFVPFCYHSLWTPFP